MIILFPFVFGLEESFSIIPPIVQTNSTEIGNWTLKGSATNMKRFIRLTSNVESDYGLICQRSPVNYRDWEMEIEFNSFGGTGGRGIWFHYTEELCPILPLEWSGLCVWVNTSRIDENGSSPIFYAINNGSVLYPNNYKYIGYIRARKKNGTTKIKIIHNANSLSIFSFENDVYTILENVSTKEIPLAGYITITSMTNQISYDNNDIISLKTTPLSEKIDLPIGIADRNRKLLQDFLATRRIKKSLRRMKMSITNKYLNLTGVENFSDSLYIIKEIIDRASSSMSIDELRLFIDDMITDKLYTAYCKIKNATESYIEIKSEITELWQGLEDQIESLHIEAKRQMEKTESELKDLVSNLRINSIDPIENISNLKHTAQKIAVLYVSKVMFFICVFEFLIYVVFVLIKKIRTNGFKKHD